MSRGGVQQGEIADLITDPGSASVRPSRRRQAHASRALRLALAESRRLGLDRVLVTCDHDNVPSRFTIERAGGVFEDRREDKLRYWFDLIG